MTGALKQVIRVDFAPHDAGAGRPAMSSGVRSPARRS
jgi:hypothetical protein